MVGRCGHSRSYPTAFVEIGFRSLALARLPDLQEPPLTGTIAHRVRLRLIGVLHPERIAALIKRIQPLESPSGLRTPVTLRGCVYLLARLLYADYPCCLLL